MNCPKCGHPINKHRDEGCFVQARDLSLCGCRLSPQELIASLDIKNTEYLIRIEGLVNERNEARRLLRRQAEEYAVYGIQPPKDLLLWLEKYGDLK